MIHGSVERNKKIDKAFKYFAFCATMVGLIALGTLIADILIDGFNRLSWDFLSNFPSRKSYKAGIYTAIMGTLWVISLTAIFSFTLGVGAGVYLEEYAKKSWFTKLIEINISNLAGVPSIIYGLLGLGIFVRAMNLDRSILAGALTLTLLILPIIITTTREALKSIPSTIREASLALGATKWQTVWHQVLPVAMPGIFTGGILALSRAIGETAPLVAVGALAYIAFTPESIMDPFTVLPIQIFNWVARPQPEFAINAAAAIIVLLVITLVMNGIAIYLRHKLSKRYKW